ncbi:MAG: PA2169 family four-helix-bundle protein [Cryomorphaceae bacterium]
MIDLLNKILQTNLDASAGYAFAAEEIENDNFRNFLKSYAARRKRYADELEAEIVKLGGKSQSDTSLLGEVHQAFMKIREAVSINHDAALLDECVRGEGEAISQYEKVLKTDKLNTDLRQLIMTQFDKVRAARSTMEELERVV